ncbi:ArdC-like ssDNA-binding domain-containing protein [Metabacillus herbersteinensis]|uniref:ArdC-like ssDNA-binding domain-containing protein n=1 Tax=Metabacillus herbersteinensis TaxID=283816 RepID=A0ABV6GIS6_9BACI
MKKNGWKQKKDQPTQKERVEQLIKQLDEGVSNFSYSPEDFKAILQMKALMPNYSFRNLIVAKAQLPRAQFIAPFKRWNELGRYVKKGQQAIRIFAPRFVKAKDENSNEDLKLVGFVTVPVFDCSQTEGEPLPIDSLKIELNGDSPEAREIINFAEKVAEKDDCPVSYGDAEGANGFYVPSQHRITVSDTLSINHRCKTLVHELVHSKVHRYDIRSSKKEKEVVAEGSAYIVCSYFGLDTSDYSFHYVKSWSKGDTESLMKYGSQICEISGKIIQEFQRLKEQQQSLQQLQTA